MCLFIFLVVATIILVGNKTDMYMDLATIFHFAENNQKFIRRKDGYEMAEEICADTYLECSAKLNEGVSEVFHTAAQIFFRNEGKPLIPQY